MPSESTAVSITMPGQGIVLADWHENLIFYRVCPHGRIGRLQPAPASLEFLLLSGAELWVLHLCRGPPGAWGS